MHKTGKIYQTERRHKRRKLLHEPNGFLFFGKSCAYMRVAGTDERKLEGKSWRVKIFKTYMMSEKVLILLCSSHLFFSPQQQHIYNIYTHISSSIK
jgi:hypothetical protein